MLRFNSDVAVLVPLLDAHDTPNFFDDACEHRECSGAFSSENSIERFDERTLNFGVRCGRMSHVARRYRDRHGVDCGANADAPSSMDRLRLGSQGSANQAGPVAQMASA